MIQAAIPTQVCADSDVSEQKADRHAHAVHSHTAMLVVRELPEHPGAAATPIGSLAPGAETSGSQSGSVPSVVSELGDPLAAESALPQAAEQHSLRVRGLALSIEQAIGSYLQEQRANGRSVKTLEWHQTALSLLQQYLVDERHLYLLCQITEAEVRGWVAFLGSTSPSKDTTRSAGTIATYARSVRAFCHWAVRNGHLDQAPIVGGTMPKRGEKSST